MAQHDYVIANGTGAAVRSDLNAGFAAIVSQNSGATAPSTTYAYQRWADTTAGVMKMRNGANNAWISLYELDGTFLAGDISLSAGAAATPSLFFTGDTNTGIYSPGADQVAISTNGTGRLLISSAGAVTQTLAAASNNGFAINNGTNDLIAIGAGGFAANGGSVTDGGIRTTNNLVFATGSGAPERLRITSTGALNFVGAGTAGSTQAVSFNGSTPVNSMVLDSSGRLLVGTSSTRSNLIGLYPRLQVEGVSDQSASTISITRNSFDSGGSALLLAKSRGEAANAVTVVQNNDILGGIYFMGADGTNVDIGAQITGEVDGTPGADDMPSRLVFSTTADGAASPTERMRINKVGQISSYVLAGANFNLVLGHGSAASSTTFLIAGTYGATDVNTGTTSFLVATNGDVTNTNNSYGAISDAKLKENIVDATSQWADVKAFRVRKYNLKQGQTHTQLGVIANEIELISPGLVTESPDRDAEGNDLGTVTKSVNYSVLYMKAVKALQEAMERIETLETRLSALEGA